MKCAAYIKDDCWEGFVEHVDRALAVWEELRPYYLRSVQRALGVRGDPVGFAIAAHDLGKLSASYQRGEGRSGYRHEVLGAYFAYRCMNSGEEAKLAVATAVMLHHEPIITSAYISGLGEQYLPLYVLRRALERADLSVRCDADEVVNYLKGVDRCLAEEVDRWRNGGLYVKDVLEVVKRILVRSSIGDIAKTHVLRAKTAAVLYPLVVSDGVAAYIGRGVCARCGGEGTKAVRAALSGAEPLDRRRLEERLCRRGGT